jgi:hypothetical protein
MTAKKGKEINIFKSLWEFGYQFEPEYTEEELRQMEEAASAQRREIENNPRQNDTNLISTDIHLEKVRKRSWSWAV